MRTARVLLATSLLAPAGLAPTIAAAGTLRVYVAGESIEVRNRYVAPPFLASGALNARGGGELRNDNEEYGWMVPLRDRLTLRAPDLTMQFVGTDVWAGANDDPYSGTYPSATPERTSAISGTSIPSWLEQRRGELASRTFCYDLAFASRGGNDFGNSDDAEYKAELKELVLLLANGSSCRADPIVVVTGHMPDDQRSGEPPATYVATVLHRFVERARDAVNELHVSNPGVRVRFADQYTPFLQNTPTTAFPSEVWSTGGIPDYAKITRIDDSYHPRRLASIYAGELAANSLDLSELRALVGSSPSGPELLLPVVLDVFGESQSHYTTELTLVSRATSTLAVSLLYTAASGGGSGTASLTLAPGEIRVIGDAIAFLRSQSLPIPADATSKVGSLKATFQGAASASEVFLGGRTSTPGNGGTFGLFYPALAREQASTTLVWVYGLRQDAAMRSNLAVVNWGDATDAVTLRITFFGSLGAPLGSPVEVTLGPGEWRQLGRPLEPFGAATGFAKVERVSGSSRFVAYGVLNDAVTSDGSFIGMSF